jgi:uncharacterized repeat protein (TIGR03803 family)
MRKTPFSIRPLQFRVLLAFKQIVKSRNFLTVFVIGTTVFFGASARGQQYQVLHQFHPDPSNPNGLIQGSDGNFYGTTSQGGPIGVGTVFKMDAAGAVTTLYSFTGSDGVRPLAALVQGSDGNFYGATASGGANGFGTVFKITSAGALTTLHSFAGSDGASPQFGRWIQAIDGNFYGTTSQGGEHNVGTVFKVTSSGAFTLLHSFAGGSDGSYPYAGLIQASDGNFYGTAALGGGSGVGTVFKMDSSGTVTTLHSFAGSDGSYPQAELIDGGDGSFYGATLSGGGPSNALNQGTVFKITPSGAFTSLHSFARVDGTQPLAGLIKGNDGNFYGTTNQGGTSSVGTVFKMDSTGTVTTLHSFAGSDGSSPSAGLIQASDGNFYGTTNGGGAEGDGTVFKMNISGTLTSFTTLYSFTGGDGYLARGGLVQGSDGNFYGTTDVGGANGATGTVFKMDSTGTLTTLHSFTGSDGVYPNYCKLVEGSDGNFYGTTNGGGTGGNGFGTVFQITPSGVLTTLHSFAKVDGSSPAAGLTKGSDGNFYGMTTFGGAMDDGTVFKITPSGTFTMLYSFSGSDGQFPFGTVIQGSDGNFYGTTLQGGATGAGSVFKMDTSGVVATVTTLHSFGGSDGAQPYGGLIQGSDGNFYGMTTIGGPGHDANSGYGTVFTITSLGALTTIHSFDGSDGAVPQGELTQGSDGNFYGTTSQGGASFNPVTFTSGYGSIFKITPAGTLTALHSFSGSDGSLPYGGPAQASDGSFYGTTEGGGLNYVGVAYRIAAPTVQLVSTVSRKMQGTAGTFDVDLTSGSGIECRSGGTNNDYTLVFTFSNTLASVGSAGVSSGSGSVSSKSIDGSDAHNYIVNLTGIANAQTIAVSLTNVTDSAGNFSTSISGVMKVLIGDTNADGFVNSADIGQTKAQSGQAVTISNFREDVNADGFVNSADIGLVKSKSGTALP